MGSLFVPTYTELRFAIGRAPLFHVFRLAVRVPLRSLKPGSTARNSMIGSGRNISHRMLGGAFLVAITSGLLVALFEVSSFSRCGNRSLEGAGQLAGNKNSVFTTRTVLEFIHPLRQ